MDPYCLIPDSLFTWVRKNSGVPFSGGPLGVYNSNLETPLSGVPQIIRTKSESHIHEYIYICINMYTYKYTSSIYIDAKQYTVYSM